MFTYEESILALRGGRLETGSDGLSMKIKQVPEDIHQGALDSRQQKWLELQKNKKALTIINPMDLTGQEVQDIRESMGCENDDLSTHIVTVERSIENIPVRIYENPGSKVDNRPIIIYFHGGGFLGGSVEVVENSCKLLAERANAVVISVDYALSPEYRFPQGLNQCWTVVCWAGKNGKSLNADGNRLAIMGDSAGANLAAACCEMDHSHLIKLQILLYPVVDLLPDVADWSLDQYNFRQEPELAKTLVDEIRNFLVPAAYSYVRSQEDFKNPLVSPIYTPDFKVFPTSFIVTAEYDYLRLQGESFAHKLHNGGVDVILYRYNGMGHAFFEHTGDFPQAEDCINEVAQAVMVI